MEIVTYRYQNKKFNTVLKSDILAINEIIAYVLSEKLILKGEGDFELDDRMLNYLSTCLGPLDKPNLNIIYNEIKQRVKEIASDYTYQCLLLGDDFYIKYDYWYDHNFSRINLYSDNAEKAWNEY